MTRWPSARRLVALAVAAIAAGAAATAHATDASVPDAGLAADSGTNAAVTDSAPGTIAPPDASAPQDARPPTAPVTILTLIKGTRAVLPVAALTLDAQPVGETDADGRFRLEVPVGTHVLQATAAGHDPARASFTVPPGESPPPLTLTLRLEPRRDGRSYETVVIAPSPEAPKIALTGDDLRKTPGSLGDPFRVIESLPGVAPVVSPAPVYAIRGANPGNTGFFVDGLRVPALFHFALGPGVITPSFIERIDFYAGGYPASYGRYVAGVVAGQTKAAPTDGTHALVDVRLYDAGAVVSTPLPNDRGSVAVAGRYSYTAGLLSLVQSDASIAYWDYQARADVRLGPGRLTTFAFGSSDNLASKDPDEAGRVLSLSFHRVDLRYGLPLGPGRLRAAVAVGVDHTRSPFEDDNELDVRARSVLPRVAYQADVHRRLGLELGADAEVQSFAVDIRTPLTQLADFLKPRTARSAGVYVAAIWRPHDAVTVSPGFRYATYGESGARADAAEPRLALRWQTSPAVALKAAGGRFSQMPSLPLQLPGFEAFGLARHGLQSSWQGSAGAEAALGGVLTADATAFLQRYVLTDVRDPRNGDPLLDDVLIRRDALAYGLEVMLRRPSTAPVYGWLAYTLSRSLRAFEGGVVAPSDWDQRHILNLVVGWRFGRNTLGARLHWHTGRLNRVDNAALPYFERLPSFYQLDVRYERRFTFDRFTVDLYAEAVNATLNREVVNRRRTEDGRLEDVSYRIILPSLGVRASF